MRRPAGASFACAERKRRSNPLACSVPSCPSDPQLLPLASQMPGHLLEDVLEHRLDAEMRPGLHRAGALRPAPAPPHKIGEFRLKLFGPLGRPLAEPVQMARQALDRIAIGPILPFVF